MSGRGARRRDKLLLLVAVACGLVAGLVAGVGREQTVRAMPECPPQRAILIDPGHGGIDGGTNVPGLLEKDIVLDVALRTRKYLERNHVPVLLTRTDDVDLGGHNDMGRLRRDVNYRVRVGNHCKVILMLSLHVNSASTPREHGMMIFYQHSRPSRDAAGLFDDVLRRSGLHDRREAPIPRSDFAVLRWSHSPAILVEMGFITNQADRQKLADPDYREKVAQALAASCAAIYHNWLKQGS